MHRAIELSLAAVLSAWPLGAAPAAAQTASAAAPRCQAHAENPAPGTVGNSRCVVGKSACSAETKPVVSGKPPGPCKCACKAVEASDADKKADKPNG